MEINLENIPRPYLGEDNVGVRPVWDGGHDVGGLVVLGQSLEQRTVGLNSEVCIMISISIY